MMLIEHLVYLQVVLGSWKAGTLYLYNYVVVHH